MVIEKKVNVAMNIAMLAVHAQGLLNAMDELSDTNIYSGKIRGLCNRLETEIVKHPKANSDNEFSQGIITEIHKGVDLVANQYKDYLLKNYKKEQELENK